MQFLRKKFPLVPVIFVALIVAAGLGYLERHRIREALFRAEQGPIPVAVTREEVAPKASENASEGAKEVETAPEPIKPDIKDEKPLEPAELPPTRPLANSPTSMNLKVLFVPQAPTLNWDHMHEEACEEAAMTMVNAYLEGRKSMTVEQMEAELQAIVDHEMTTLGYFESTDAPATAKVMAGFYGLKTVRVVPLNSIDQIKEQIAAGRPVMLPTAGRELKNPYFSGEGPIYHMVVAKGYTEDRIITNDPGTKRGADYTYSYDVLWNAIGEWTGSDTDTSKKFMIVVE